MIFSAKVRSQLRADLILQFDPAIRYAAIIDNDNTIVECKGQGTAPLPLSLERWRDFLTIEPNLILGSMGTKLQPLGRLGYVIGRFENALVTIYQLHSCVVAIVLDPTVQIQLLEEIGTYLKTMETEFAP